MQDIAAAEAAAPRLRLAAQRAAKAAAQATAEAAVAGQQETMPAHILEGRCFQIPHTHEMN